MSPTPNRAVYYLPGLWVRLDFTWIWIQPTRKKPDLVTTFKKKPDQDPTSEKKPNPDPTLEKKRNRIRPSRKTPDPNMTLEKQPYF